MLVGRRVCDRAMNGGGVGIGVCLVCVVCDVVVIHPACIPFVGCMLDVLARSLATGRPRCATAARFAISCTHDAQAHAQLLQIARDSENTHISVVYR